MGKLQDIGDFVNTQIQILRYILFNAPIGLRIYAVIWIIWVVFWTVFLMAAMFDQIGNFYADLYLRSVTTSGQFNIYAYKFTQGIWYITIVFILAFLVGLPYIPMYYWYTGHKEKAKPSGIEASSTITQIEQLEDVVGETQVPATPYALETPQVAAPQPELLSKPVPVEPEYDIHITSSFSYRGAKIIYKIKVENPTAETVGDIKVRLFVSEVLLLKEKEKHITLLKPDESETATFEIRPTGECGDCEVSGTVSYYDYASKKTKEVDIPPKSLSIICPMLHVKEIDKPVWKDTIARLVHAEESTKEIQIPAETLFTMLSRVLEDMNLFMLKPEVTATPQLFNGLARFYAEGVRGLKYAAQIEIVGGTKNSKLILKAWAEKEEALTGFYYGVLDEIEKRVQVKGYIEDSIVQHFYHIGTVVKDSVVQRSTIGSEGEAGKKCSRCGNAVSEDEQFCPKCGEKLQ